MNEKPKVKTLPKQELEITHIEIDVPYSQGTKSLDRIKAINRSLPDDHPLAGKELRMTIFNQSVKSFVRGKNKVVADIEERERDNSEYGPDRTIVQAYDDQGNPVSKKQASGGYRRTLEDDLALEAVKRRSIEGQAAITQIGALLTSSAPINIEDLALTADDWKRILAKYWKAVEKGLDNYLPVTPSSQVVKLTQEKPAEPRQTTQDKQGTVQKDDKVKDSNKPNDPIKNIGDLLNRAMKLKPPVSRDELLIALSISDPKEIKDLEAAWKMAQEISQYNREGESARAAVDSQGVGKLFD